MCTVRGAVYYYPRFKVPASLACSEQVDARSHEVRLALQLCTPRSRRQPKCLLPKKLLDMVPKCIALPFCFRIRDNLPLLLLLHIIYLYVYNMNTNPVQLRSTSLSVSTGLWFLSTSPASTAWSTCKSRRGVLIQMMETTRQSRTALTSLQLATKHLQKEWRLASNQYTSNTRGIDGGKEARIPF